MGFVTSKQQQTAWTSGVDLDAMRELASPLLLAHGLELVDLELTGGPLRRVLRVTIERPEGRDGVEAGPAVTLDDCVRVSRDLSTALDVEDLVEANYSLEVSSPGLDRPLTQLSDFRRQLGKLAKVRLIEPAADGQRVLRGTIADVEVDRIVMKVDGNLHEVRLENVKEAKLVFELGGQPKKGARSNKARRRGHRAPRGAKKTAG